MATSFASGKSNLALTAIASMSLLSALTGHAQQPATSAGPATNKVASASAEKMAPPAYQSAFESYQPFTDEKTANWKEANDLAGRIGGWRAYAKEASGEVDASGPAEKQKAQP